METNIIKDLSTLTTINESTLNKLVEKIVWCISDSVEKAVIAKENIVELDIGLGKLLIQLSNDTIKYKFKPSVKLENTVSSTYLNERNELINTLEESLVNKITNVYKNFC